MPKIVALAYRAKTFFFGRKHGTHKFRWPVLGSFKQAAAEVSLGQLMGSTL